jgi:hypothetical protein
VKKLLMLTPQLVAFGTFSIILRRPRGGFRFATLSLWQILPHSIVPIADSPCSYKNSSGCSHSRHPLAAKEDHFENLNIQNLRTKTNFLRKIKMLRVMKKCVYNAMKS